MKIINDKIAKSEMKAAIIRSGYLLESRVSSVLDRYDYFVELNIVFQDPETKNCREIDLFANYRGMHFVSKNSMIFISTSLIVECINNPQPIVYFANRAFNLNPLLQKIRFAALPPYTDKEDHFIDDIDFEEILYSGKAHLFTQYCSFSRKKKSGNNLKDEWMASHSDELYDTFKKLLQITDFKMKELSDWYLKKQGRRKDILAQCVFFQPVLIVQGEIYIAEGMKKSIKLRQAHRISFEFNYQYQHKDKASTIIIDVLSEKHLPAYLEIIQNRANKIGTHIEKTRYLER